MQYLVKGLRGTIMRLITILTICHMKVSAPSTCPKLLPLP